MPYEQRGTAKRQASRNWDREDPGGLGRLVPGQQSFPFSYSCNDDVWVYNICLPGLGLLSLFTIFLHPIPVEKGEGASPCFFLRPDTIRSAWRPMPCFFRPSTSATNPLQQHTYTPSALREGTRIEHRPAGREVVAARTDTHLHSDILNSGKRYVKDASLGYPFWWSGLLHSMDIHTLV